MTPTIYLNRFKHVTTALIKLFFYENESLENKLQALSYVYYSHHYRCYYIRDKKELISKLKHDLESIAYVSERYLNPEAFFDKMVSKHKNSTTGEPVNSVTYIPTIRCSIVGSKCYLYVPQKLEWSSFLQDIGCIFESKRKIWLVPNYQVKLRAIKPYFYSQGCRFEIKVKDIDKKAQHLKRQDYKSDKEVQDFHKILTLQGASKRTIENYCSQIKKLKDYYDGKPICDISDEEIRDYLFFLREELSYSRSAQNIVVSAVKRYMLAMTEREIDVLLIPRPAKKKLLPKVLDKDEVEAILRQKNSIKHKCILFLLYSTGMRCGELINLQVEDLNFDDNIILIRSGKGDKGRIVSMPKKLKHLLKGHLRSEQPSTYFFEGQKGGQYSSSSVQRVVKSTVLKAGIDKRVTPHMLRHSFATHLHDVGMDIRNIQRLLGHSSTKTTEIYTYISKRDIRRLKSPLDDLDV